MDIDDHEYENEEEDYLFSQLLSQRDELEFEDQGQDGEQGKEKEKPIAATVNTAATATAIGEGDEGFLYRLNLGNKAGLGISTDRMRNKIADTTTNSKFVENEKRKAEITEGRVAQMKQDLEKLCRDEAQLRSARDASDALVLKLESDRNVNHCYCVVDMDAFYVQVEERDDPSLKGKPVAVGGLSMLSTSNYEARKYGVRSAMPGFTALKLCPALTIIPGDHSKYSEVSHDVMQVCALFDPNYSAASLDEAYLDLTGYLEEKGLDLSDAGMVVEELRCKIYERTQLTASAGIGPTATLAKIASNINKPNGQYIVPCDRDAVLRFLRPRPVRDVPGVGKVTEHVLKALGIHTCGDVLAKRAYVYALFSPISREFFIRSALGISSESSRSGHDSTYSRKSVSCERTFRATNDLNELVNTHVAKLSHLLIQRLNKHVHVHKEGDLEGEGEGEDLQSLDRGRTLTMKLKRSDFTVVTRAVAVDKSKSAGAGIGDWRWTPERLFEYAVPLLQREMRENKTPVRLLGLRLSGFDDVNRDGDGGATTTVSTVTMDAFLPCEDGGEDEGGKRKRPQCPICDRPIIGDQNEHVDHCLESVNSNGKGKERKKRKNQKQQKIDVYTVPYEILKE